MAAWISAHGLEGSPAVVWSADAWLYDLTTSSCSCRRRPSTTTSISSATTGPVAQRVADLEPALVITEGESRTTWPEINSVLATGYTDSTNRAPRSSGCATIWSPR